MRKINPILKHQKQELKQEKQGKRKAWLLNPSVKWSFFGLAIPRFYIVWVMIIVFVITITATILLNTIEYMPSITAEKFSERLTASNYIVTFIESEDESIKSYRVEKDDLKVDFFEFSSSYNATSFFDKTKRSFRNEWSDSYQRSSYSFGTYKWHEFIGINIEFATQRNNTVVVSICKKEKRNELHDILKLIGY